MKKDIGYIASVTEWEGSWDRPDGYVLADSMEAGLAKKKWIHSRGTKEEHSLVEDFRMIELTEEGVKLLNDSPEKAEWVFKDITKYAIFSNE